MKIKILMLSLALLMMIGTVVAETAQRVAVIDFHPQERGVRTLVNQMMHNRRGDFAVLFPEYPQFELIDLNESKSAFDDLGLANVITISSNQASELGEKLGADIVIWGSVTDHSAAEIRVSANIMNVRTGSINRLAFNLSKRSADRREGMKNELIEQIMELAGGEILRLFEIGEQQLAANNFNRARDTYQRIVDIDPDNIEAYFLLGYVEFMRRDYESSEDYYQQALLLSPGEERILNNLAETQRLAGKHQEAIATLRRLADIRPDEMVWLRIGNIYTEINFIYEAIAAYEEVLELNPESEQAHYRLGVLLFDNNYFGDSIPHLEFIAEIHPEDELINRKLTSAYLRTDQLDQVIASYINQIERDPRNVTAYLNLAGAYRTLERNQEALRTLNQLLEFEDDNPTVYIRLADVKLAMNNLQAAENDANTALRIDPQSHEPYMVLAQIYQVRGYSSYENFIDLEEKARLAYGSEADRLVGERDEARNRANQLFSAAHQYLENAEDRTGEPAIIRDISARKQLLSQLIEETRRTFFD